MTNGFCENILFFLRKSGGISIKPLALALTSLLEKDEAEANNGHHDNHSDDNEEEGADEAEFRGLRVFRVVTRRRRKLRVRHDFGRIELQSGSLFQTFYSAWRLTKKLFCLMRPCCIIFWCLFWCACIIGMNHNCRRIICLLENIIIFPPINNKNIIYILNNLYFSEKKPVNFKQYLWKCVSRVTETSLHPLLA